MNPSGMRNTEINDLRRTHFRHLRKMNEVSSTIDNNEPASLNLKHVKNNYKRAAMREDEQKRIDRDNKYLVNSMLRFIKEADQGTDKSAAEPRAPEPSTGSPRKKKTSYRRRQMEVKQRQREKEQKVIADQNMYILKRLMSTKTIYGQKEITPKHFPMRHPGADKKLQPLLSMPATLKKGSKGGAAEAFPRSPQPPRDGSKSPQKIYPHIARALSMMPSSSTYRHYIVRNVGLKIEAHYYTLSVYLRRPAKKEKASGGGSRFTTRRVDPATKTFIVRIDDPITGDEASVEVLGEMVLSTLPADPKPHLTGVRARDTWLQFMGHCHIEQDPLTVSIKTTGTAPWAAAPAVDEDYEDEGFEVEVDEVDDEVAEEIDEQGSPRTVRTLAADAEQHHETGKVKRGKKKRKKRGPEPTPVDDTPAEAMQEEAIKDIPDDAETNAAAAKLQARARGRKSRAKVAEMEEKTAAATKLQSLRRGSQARTKVKQKKQEDVAAAKLQARIRGSSARIEVAEKKKKKQANAGSTAVDIPDDAETNAAAARLQSRVRGSKARQRVQEKKEQEVAAAKLQSRIRGSKARQRVAEKKQQDKAAARLQARIRGSFARIEMAEKKKKKQATASAAAEPSAVDIPDDAETNAAAAKLQSRLRGSKARQRVAEKKEQANAATKLQASFRGHVARSNSAGTDEAKRDPEAGDEDDAPRTSERLGRRDSLPIMKDQFEKAKQELAAQGRLANQAGATPNAGGQKETSQASETSSGSGRKKKKRNRIVSFADDGGASEPEAAKAAPEEEETTRASLANVATATATEVIDAALKKT